MSSGALRSAMALLVGPWSPIVQDKVSLISASNSVNLSDPYSLVVVHNHVLPTACGSLCAIGMPCPLLLQFNQNLITLFYRLTLSMKTRLYDSSKFASPWADLSALMLTIYFFLLYCIMLDIELATLEHVLCRYRFTLSHVNYTRDVTRELEFWIFRLSQFVSRLVHRSRHSR